MKTLRLTDCDFAAAAERLGTDVPSLRAVHEVETGSSNGFWAPGKPIILFEGHVFWKQLEQRGISPPRLLPEMKASFIRVGHGGITVRNGKSMPVLPALSESMRKPP